MENQRKIELFDLLKSKLEEEFNQVADQLSNSDEEAKEEYEKLNTLNNDVGGSCGFDYLPEHIQDRLIEEAKDNSYVLSVDHYDYKGEEIVEILNKILEG